MRIDIMTLFPDQVSHVLGESIIGRAAKKGIIEINADGSITDRMCTYDEYVHLNELEAQP